MLDPAPMLFGRGLLGELLHELDGQIEQAQYQEHPVQACGGDNQPLGHQGHGRLHRDFRHGVRAADDLRGGGENKQGQ